MEELVSMELTILSMGNDCHKDRNRRFHQQRECKLFCVNPKD